MLGPRGELLVGSSKFGFGLAQLGDIRVSAKPADDPAFGIADGESARKEPSILPVLASEWKSVFPALARFRRPLDARRNAVDVIGMMKGLPTPIPHFLEGRAGIVVPTPIIPGRIAKAVADPRQLGNVIGHHPKAFLTFAQGIFRFFALGNVVEKNGHSTGGGLTHREGINVEPAS